MADVFNILDIPPTGGGGALAMVLIEDQKAQGTDAGGFTSGSYQTRDLNTTVIDTGGNVVALAANQIELAAGTYRVVARAPAIQVDEHSLRLQNITGAATLITGPNARASGANICTHAFLEGRFTIAAGQDIELQHRCTVTRATFGFGDDQNFAGVLERYAQIIFFKE